MEPVGRLRWAGPAFALVTVLSLFVLFWPSPAGGGGRLPGADKAVHVGLFLLLAVTARLRFGVKVQILAAVLAYAALSELVQVQLLPRRSGDPLDVVANAAGAAVGWRLAGRWTSS